MQYEAVTFKTISEMVDNYARVSFSTVRDFFVSRCMPYNELTRFLSTEDNSHIIPSVTSRDEGKYVFIISGSIGAGKSTIAHALYRYFELENLPYVSTDIFYISYYKEKSVFDADYNQARKLTDRLLASYSKLGNPFIWESVLSKEKKRTYIEALRQIGYYIISVYVTVDTPEKAIERSNIRALDGFHHVDSNFIRDRYVKSAESFRWINQCADKSIVLDNTTKLSLIYYKEGSSTLYMDESKKFLFL